jgi:hypothetical protein
VLNWNSKLKAWTLLIQGSSPSSYFCRAHSNGGAGCCGTPASGKTALERLAACAGAARGLMKESTVSWAEPSAAKKSSVAVIHISAAGTASWASGAEGSRPCIRHRGRSKS